MNSYLAIWIGLTIGNFIYQVGRNWVTSENKWEPAFDRSYFQGFAIFLCWMWA